MSKLIYVDRLKKDIKEQTVLLRALGNEEITMIADIMEKGFLEEIDKQPTIEERKWIPCSERLPEEKSDWKTVTVVDESGDTVFTYSSVGFYLSDGWWIVDNEPMEGDALIRVIAWMPLPEPYKEGNT